MNDRIYQVQPIMELIAIAGHSLTLCDRSVVAESNLEKAIPTQVALTSYQQLRGYVVDQEKAIKISGGSIGTGEHLAYVLAEDFPKDLKPSHQIIFEDNTFQIEEQQRIRDGWGEILVFIKLKPAQESDRPISQIDQVFELESEPEYIQSPYYQ